MRLLVDVNARRVEKTHTLLVTGGDGFRVATENRQLIAEVQRLARTSQRVVSICTGAFVLAKAGLLDHRQATTHWAYARELKAQHRASM